VIAPRQPVTLDDLLAGRGPGFIRASDFADMCGLSRQAIQREIEQGRLGAQQFALRGCWFVPRAAALGWLAAHGVLHAQAS
jgi:hypothetical protein